MRRGFISIIYFTNCRTHNLIDFLRTSLSLFNLLMLLALIASVLKYFKKVKASNILFLICAVIFLLISTGYIPSYLVKKLESKYFPVSNVVLENVCQDSVYIVVLASGYSVDYKLPAINQLDINSLGRLAEGIRIKKLCRQSTLICSGYSSQGLETQASVTKRAAIELGVDENEIRTMDAPGSTIEEALEFNKIFKTNRKVILVTDAIHMERAVAFFKYAGAINIIPAPTNFRIKEEIIQRKEYIPSLSNIGLMEMLWHEYLGTLKFYLTK